ncbi:MAG: flagellar export chaperone FliS [Immundisolibacteraceae bacterium]|nr:flagellar export chaperone FliS [Immundisolibacteraceae bacterium]
MSHPDALKSYRQIQSQTVLNASPYHLILKLFDGLLQRLASARGHIERQEVAEKGQCLGSAISIIGGLRGSISHVAGGEIATNLDNLYEYCERRLMQANQDNDTTIIDEVAGLLKDIRSAWLEIPPAIQQQEASNSDMPVAVSAAAK